MAARVKRKTPAGAEPKQAAQADGGLLSVTSEGMVGWAWNPASPGDPMRVVLLANDVVVGAGWADRHDDERVRQRVGPGVPGFLIPLGAFPEAVFPLTFTLRASSGEVLGAPLTLKTVEDLGVLLPAPVPRQIEGLLELIHQASLIGWVWSPAAPETPVVVELYDGAERIDRRVADMHRDDLAAAGKRGGQCGFRFELPITLLDGKFHTLHVRVANSTHELANSPISFGPLAASGLIEEVVRLQQEVKRLAQLVDHAVAPNGAFQTGVLRSLSERVAAYADIQREMVESELDALRAMVLKPGASAEAEEGVSATRRLRQPR